MKDVLQQCSNVQVIGNGSPKIFSLPQEIWYYANQGNKIRADDITAESTSVQIQEKGNQELAEALIGEGGVMQAGFQPEFETATDEGSKQLVEAMNNAESKAAKPKKGNKNKEENQKAEPQTLPEPMS